MRQESRVRGPNGERYEVRCTDAKGQDVAVGWCTDPDGRALVDAVELAAGCHGAYVVDLVEEGKRE